MLAIKIYNQFLFIFKIKTNKCMLKFKLSINNFGMKSMIIHSNCKHNGNCHIKTYLDVKDFEMTDFLCIKCCICENNIYDCGSKPRYNIAIHYTYNVDITITSFNLDKKELENKVYKNVYGTINPPHQYYSIENALKKYDVDINDGSTADMKFELHKRMWNEL